MSQSDVCRQLHKFSINGHPFNRFITTLSLIFTSTANIVIKLTLISEFPKTQINDRFFEFRVVFRWQCCTAHLQHFHCPTIKRHDTPLIRYSLYRHLNIVNERFHFQDLDIFSQSIHIAIVIMLFTAMFTGVSECLDRCFTGAGKYPP